MSVKKEERLLSLLDDEDENVAVEVIAELLDNEDSLVQTLSTYRISTNDLMRKRIHQLQSALTQRHRRRKFFKMLQAKEVDMIEGLIAIHLQWFDSEVEQNINDSWQAFLERADKFKPDSLERLSLFMRRCEMTGDRETSTMPGNYCIGEVLRDRVGASSLFCAMVQVVAERFGLKLSIAKVLGEFVLFDDTTRSVLIPWQDWSIRKVRRVAKCEIWNRKEVLRFMSAMLFSHAVNSDSFRYVMTISQSLTGVKDGDLPTEFPYPYSILD